MEMLGALYKNAQEGTQLIKNLLRGTQTQNLKMLWGKRILGVMQSWASSWLQHVPGMWPWACHVTFLPVSDSKSLSSFAEKT